MITLNTSLELLTWAEICERYPDAWVMLAYPETEYQQSKDQRKGYVLYAEEDAEAFQAYSIENTPKNVASKQYRLYADRYTGKKEPITVKRMLQHFKKIDA